MSLKLEVGAIIENHVRQYAKVISVKNGVYGLSDWMTRDNAEKATIAVRHINVYGMQYAGIKVVSAVKASKPSAKSVPSDEAGKPTAAKTAKPKSAKTGTGKAKAAKSKTAKPRSSKGSK